MRVRQRRAGRKGVRKTRRLMLPTMQWDDYKVKQHSHMMSRDIFKAEQGSKKDSRWKNRQGSLHQALSQRHNCQAMRYKAAWWRKLFTMWISRRFEIHQWKKLGQLKVLRQFKVRIILEMAVQLPDHITRDNRFKGHDTCKRSRC